MIKELEITCRAINSVVAYGSSGDITVTLNNPSMSLIEQLDESDIVSYADMNKVLDEMDFAKIADYLENKYDVKIIDLSKEV